MFFHIPQSLPYLATATIDAQHYPPPNHPFVVAKIMHFAAIGVSFSYGRDLRPCLLSRAYVVGEFLFYFFLLGLKGPFLFCFSF